MIQEKEKIKSPILCFLEIILIYICMYVCMSATGHFGKWTKKKSKAQT